MLKEGKKAAEGRRVKTAIEKRARRPVARAGAMRGKPGGGGRSNAGLSHRGRDFSLGPAKSQRGGLSQGVGDELGVVFSLASIH